MRTETEGRKAKKAADAEILRRMNSNLRDFLEHSLISDSFWEKWTALSLPVDTIRCWEIKDCARADCPSFHDEGSRCWLKVGTLCGGMVQGDFAKKYRSCFSCKVMKEMEADEVRSLYEHVNILIHHLKKRDEKIVSAAITDQLTGVYNRAYFNEFIDKRVAHAGRYEENISFIMIDLDGFKGLNDTYGHQAGDDVLIEAASLLKQMIRRSDLLFRYGGDEFLIILPYADCVRAETVKERIRTAAEQWNLQNRRYVGFRLSLSTGCSTWKQGDDVFARIREADALMYEEKKQKKTVPSARQVSADSAPAKKGPAT